MDAVGVLRDIPGLVIASPSRPDDAAAMLRTCLAAAAVDGSVCVFLEPIALYHTHDLHSDSDGGWYLVLQFRNLSNGFGNVKLVRQGYAARTGLWKTRRGSRWTWYGRFVTIFASA